MGTRQPHGYTTRKVKLKAKTTYFDFEDADGLSISVSKEFYKITIYCADKYTVAYGNVKDIHSYLKKDGGQNGN